MSRFTRASPWLRRIFPSSEAPIEDIGDLSDTVFLTQPFIDPFGIRSPNGWFSDAGLNTLAGGNQLIDLGSINAEEIVRVLGISYHFQVGPTSNTRMYVVGSLEAAGTLNVNTGLYGPLTEAVETGTTFARGTFRATSPIIGGGHFLSLVVMNGTLNDQVRIKFYFVAAPIGTIFYI